MSELVDRLWGVGDLSAVFPGGTPKSVCPWPRVGRRKAAPPLSRLLPPAFANEPVGLEPVDPRTLWCSQPWVVFEHASYYLTGRWERTGLTSADHEVALNRYPVIVREPGGRDVIISGHHRSLAALVTGRPVICRRFPAETATATALLPHLLVGETTPLDAVRCATVDEAIAVVVSGRPALVTDAAVAELAAAVLRADHL